MLTRKHFERIAHHLRQRMPHNPGTKLGYHLAITAVANALQEINPRFDRDLFLRAASFGEVSVPQEQQVLDLVD